MICPNCKANNFAGMLFCARCGRALPRVGGEETFIPVLSWTAPDDTVERFPITKPTLQLGRVAGNDVIIADNAVSRQHARLVMIDGRLVLFDLGSLNGTFVNGVRVEDQVVLRDGDEIRLGRTRLTISIPPLPTLPGVRSARAHPMPDQPRTGAAPSMPREATQPLSRPAGDATIEVGAAPAAEESPLASPSRDSAEPPAELTIAQSEQLVLALPDAAPASAPADALEAADAASPPAQASEQASGPELADPTMLNAPEFAPDESAAEPALPGSNADATLLGADAGLVSPPGSATPEAVKPEQPAAWLVGPFGRCPVVERITIGRVAGNDVVLAEDRQVSRHHAAIEARPDGVYLIDLGSSNGSFVNGERVTTEVRLQGGEAIRLGASELTVELPWAAPLPDDADPTLVGPAVALPSDRTLAAEAVADDQTIIERSVPLSSAPVASSTNGSHRPVPPEEIRRVALAEFLDKPRLAVTWGPQSGQEFLLTSNSVTIGRDTADANYDVRLQDRAVSRPHARITRQGDQYVLEDLDSANGTWVNYEEIKGPRLLNDGDVIKVGKTVLVFRSPLGPNPLAPSRLSSDRSQVLTFFSLKGGVGTTALAVNLAVELRQLTDRPVALLDLSVERGAAALHLNLQPKRTVADLAVADLREVDGSMVQSVILRHASGLDLIAAPPSPQSAELITPELIGAVLPILREQYAWVVVDTSSTFSELNLSLFDQSDLILTVLTPDVTALKVTQSTLDVFSALGIAGEKQILILNQIVPKVHLQQEQVEQALGERIHFVVPYGGETFTDTVDRGAPVVVGNRAHPVALAIEQVAGRLANVERSPAPARGGSWLSRLQSRLKIRR